MAPTQQQAVQNHESLSILEGETGTRTTRARNAVLQSLTDADLIAVFVALRERGLIGGTR